ncbi:beta-propeller domain-containing protein [Marinimicrobium sp. C6131]|uniref:beta-propeller domain-containing protein n=1 Tax=Marinimicrobium sp. C6131 TaxID=3022676 RepID=UPI00223E4783|nr:beta-propeller domain-containing protein [Marinimicrobium sp. C6131]UZJ44574.1 beta-propeller domain-containing protein [Marinimicrobium sp. C6131]
MNVRSVTLCALAASAMLLAACGGSSGDGPGPGRYDTDYRQLRWADPALEPLTNEHPPEAVSQYLRNGLRLQVSAVDNGMVEEDGVAMPDAQENAAGDFSRTNVHVEGVDEADRLKYDGRYLFVAESPQYSYHRFAESVALDDAAGDDGSVPEPAAVQALRIFETDPAQASATGVMRYTLDREADSPLVLSQLYTLEQGGTTEAVVALSDSRYYYGGWGWMGMPEIALQAGHTRIELVDVQSPENPAIRWSLEVEGTLLNSRKIGDVLYLVSRTRPHIEGLEPYAGTDEARQNNERLISSTPMSELLPGYRMDESPEQPLVREGDCYLPETLNPDEGFADIVTVSAFNLREQRLVSAICVNAYLSGLYLSLDSLYLGTHAGNWLDQKTGLHKFAIAGGEIDYRGTGLVPGALNWSDPSFSMDEAQGYLRVVTTLREDWSNPEHFLHVLREAADPDSRTLEVVARLPNEAQPEPIGKPGEDIYAVRFLGDRAYIVTFERIDPLYVLDVSDNENPSVLGELEIPGVSNYLHPVGEGYLVSVGQEADENGGFGGVKVELFDVRDDLNPVSVEAVVLGGSGSWSEALTDLRAFNFLPVGTDQLRFTVPVTRRDDYRWLDTGLFLFEVNGLTGEQATLETQAPLIVASANSSGFEYPVGGGSDRSRLHGDTVYYLHGNDIWARDWDDPESLNGPFGFNTGE